MGPVLGPLPPAQEMQITFLVPGFALVRVQLLKELGK